MTTSGQSPEMVEGPFYAGGGDFRSDIREDRKGLALDLTITVVNATSGAPFAGVDVDLWQCDATGHYSGYDIDPDEVPQDISTGQSATNDETYLRGRQTADADGKVTFRTIYPGWYRLRTPHIHLKIFEGETCNTTTQLYLPEDLNQDICERPEYARRAEQDTFNNTDPVIATTQGDIESLWVDIEKRSDSLVGTATITIVPGYENEPIHPPPGRIPPVGGRPHDKPVR